ncbi:hypothetical protein, partial [Desulforamulus ruminis]|uniref:hypothetical protein n=1 Tax=Desulforamulus ruminis TaxID=1564 RepID=UPI002355CBD2
FSSYTIAVPSNFSPPLDAWFVAPFFRWLLILQCFKLFSFQIVGIQSVPAAFITGSPKKKYLLL